MPTTRTPFVTVFNAANVTWTNMPSALTELFGLTHRRARIDFTDVQKIRLSVRVSTVGATNAVIFAQYSTDESVWNDLTTDRILINGSVGTKVSAWESIPAAAVGDVFVRIVGESGNGIADPVIGNACLQYR